MMIREITTLPEQFIQSLEDRGYNSLYPPQEEALKTGVLEGKNLVLATPTASGKTLVAMMASIKAVESGGKVVYLAPLRALASEKYDEFKQIFGQIKRSEKSRRGFRVMISTGDYDSSGDSLGAGDIIVLTNERFDSILRHGASWTDSVSLFIADEVHLVGDDHRGPTLEMILAKVIRFVPTAQILGLSATISNTGDLAKWLGAELVDMDWRPVKLIEGVHDYGTLSFVDGVSKKISQSNRGAAIDVALDSVRDSGQALIFCETRKRAVVTAEKAGEVVPNFLTFDESTKLREISQRILSSGEETDVSRRLAEIVARGAAFHHAGLDSRHRKIVEEAFKQHQIKVLTSTPTLCLPPDQEIICNSTIKPISEISEEERVLTHEGKYELTNGSISRYYSGELVTLSPYYQLPMSMTPEHYVLCAQRIRRSTHSGKINKHWWVYSEPRWKMAKYLEKNDLVLFPRIKEENNDTQLSVDFLELCGYYISEGCTSESGAIIFDVSTNEEALTKDITKKLMQLGLRVRFTDKERHRRRIYGCSKRWAAYFRSNFGGHALEKAVPHNFIYLPAEKIRALLRGLWRGDGSFAHGHAATARYCTISKHLAYQMYVMLSKIGFLPSLYLDKRLGGLGKHPRFVLKISGRQLGNFAKDVLRVAYSDSGNREFLLGHVDDDYLYLPLKSIGRKKYEGDVYNLEVDSDSSYVGSFIVHNSAGVNLPARRVVLSSLLRYDAEAGGQAPISVLEFKQMAGRAGRPRYDTVGEIVLLAGPNMSSQELLEQYIRAKPEPIRSKLSADGPLRSHLLGLIASVPGMAEGELLQFFERTLFAAQYRELTVKSRIKKALLYLEEEALIIRKLRKFIATQFGKRVAMLYIDPESAIIMRRGIKFAPRGNSHALGLLHLIVQTPDMVPKFRTRQKDSAELEEVFSIREGELLVPLPSKSDFAYYQQYDSLLGDFRTVLALNAWINEKTEQFILEKYSVEPGDLHRMVDNADWLLYSCGELAKLFERNDLVFESDELRERVRYGILPELIQLTKLEGIGRVRARALFSAGYTTIEKLEETPVEKLAQIPKIGNFVAAQIKEQLH